MNLRNLYKKAISLQEKFANFIYNILYGAKRIAPPPHATT
jgi:hypothetical protein